MTCWDLSCIHAHVCLSYGKPDEAVKLSEGGVKSFLCYFQVN